MVYERGKAHAARSGALNLVLLLCLGGESGGRHECTACSVPSVLCNAEGVLDDVERGEHDEDNQQRAGRA